MLGNEHRVAAHRRLPPVVERFGWGEALPDQLVRMFGKYPEPALGSIAPLLRPEAETLPERRAKTMSRSRITLKLVHSTRFVSAASNC